MLIKVLNYQATTSLFNWAANQWSGKYECAFAVMAMILFSIGNSWERKRRYGFGFSIANNWSDHHSD